MTKILTITVTLDAADVPGRAGRIGASDLVNLFYGIDDGQVSASYDTAVRDAQPGPDGSPGYELEARRSAPAACAGHDDSPGYGE